MLKVMSILLMFGSISILAYLYLPLFLRRYTQIQKTRMEQTSKQLDQTFVLTERQRFIKVFTITPLTLGLLGFILFRNPLGVGGGLVLGLVLPSFILKNMQSRRRVKFQSQLVDALMLLSGSLKAGMSLSQALEVLVEEMPAPMSDEFNLVVKENKLGVDLEECLLHLRKRMPVNDLDLIAIAITIARETGGNLTEIFENLVFTIREKRRLEDRVRVLTVQGRMQGYIMMVLPIGFAVFIYFVNPHNFEILLQDKLGQMLLTWAIISEAIGIILIKKLSRIEV